jgi:type VI secretion system protein ImpM
MRVKSATVVGFYGKLPCRGDFLHRRVPQEFVDVWDAWVRESLSESRRQLRDRWLDAYLTSPVWRFVLTEGLCGTDAYAGLILPSVDRVGRYFPLTIVARWEVDVFPLEAACNQERWFESAEALALHALEAPSLDFDDFDRGVARLAAQIDASVEPSACLPSLEERRMRPVSVWWTDGSNEIAPGMLCVTGLPEPSGFAAMLSGARAEPGWTE